MRSAVCPANAHEQSAPLKTRYDREIKDEDLASCYPKQLDALVFSLALVRIE